MFRFFGKKIRSKSVFRKWFEFELPSENWAMKFYFFGDSFKLIEFESDFTLKESSFLFDLKRGFAYQIAFKIWWLLELLKSFFDWIKEWRFTRVLNFEKCINLNNWRPFWSIKMSFWRRNFKMQRIRVFCRLKHLSFTILLNKPINCCHKNHKISNYQKSKKKFLSVIDLENYLSKISFTLIAQKVLKLLCYNEKIQ